MGTVGLNFGSATSGQGFDVTSTVNQIVTNLQSVETPWKNQLSSLQSQDTALSSIGTLVSTLATDLQNLSDFNGALSSKTGSSSDTNVVSLTSASSNAVAGTHTVTVQNLSQTSSAATDSVGASDTLTGSITFKVGAGDWQTVNVGDNSSDATLAGLASAINSDGLGVVASVLTNSNGTQRLSLVSRTSGAAGQITIADSGNNPSSPTTLADSTNPDSNAGLGLKTIQDGIDAAFTVDGVALTSSSNSVSNAIPGITFQLVSTGSSSGTPEAVQVVIANDTNTVATAIETFVSDYNAVIKAINTQEGKDSSGNAEPLYGSSIIAQLQQGLQSALTSTFGAGSIDTLISLGITASSSADGTITLDGDTLTNALNSNYSQVESFFQDLGNFGTTFSSTLHQLGNNSGANGAISLALKENASREKSLNDNISHQEDLIATQKASLTAQLNLANQILQSIPEQIQQINELYSAITGYNNKNS